jgi:hypothetical protein
VEQAYRYPKDAWSREQAEAHCRSHDGSFEAAFTGDGLELVYLASVHSIETGQEQNLATFYLMNTSRNRNKWAVTDKALEDALPTLLKKSIGVGPGYKVDKHYSKPLITGTFVKGDKPDGYALGTAEITDPHVWELLKSGKLGPISVVVSSYRETCSACGEVLTGEEAPFEHKCIKKGDAYVQVESFKFNRVDFINVPAYPQAGLLNMAAESESGAVPIELLAGFYTSQSTNELTSGRGVGSLGINLETRIKQRKKPKMSLTLEEAVAKVKELEASVVTLEKERDAVTKERNDITKERDALKAKADNPEKDSELEALKTELAAMKKGIHDGLVDAVVEARFKAGLIAKKEDEKARIIEFSDDMLKILTEDALLVAGKLEAVKSSGPKSRYGVTETNDFKEAMEKQREAFYGYRRGLDGTVLS